MFVFPAPGPPTINIAFCLTDSGEKPPSKLGIVYITLLLVRANVSSKSNTLIFLTGAFNFLALFRALSALLKASILVLTVIALLYFMESGIKSLLRLEAIALPLTKGR